jgi:hypothetical protein
MYLLGLILEVIDTDFIVYENSIPYTVALKVTGAFRMNFYEVTITSQII